MRLFIAIPLPAEVAAAASKVLPDMAGLRRVEPALMHLTLAFLGATPDARLDDVIAATRAGAADHDAFAISLDRAGRFPTSGSPRVAWLGMRDGTAESAALAEGIRRQLASRSLTFDEKPFRAHITLGRVRENATRDEARAIGASLDAAAVPAMRFAVETVHVIESHVSAKGPRYTSRASLALSVGGQR